MYAKSKKGFTLIELLTVIAIIGLLMTIIVVSLGGAKAKSRDARRVADIKNIQLALSMYYNDNGMYPVNIYSSASGSAAPLNGLAPAYLPAVPTDPNQSGTCTGTETSVCYKYSAFNTVSPAACNNTTRVPVRYHLAAVMEETTNGALTQDADAPVAPNGSMAGMSKCGNSAGTGDIDGTSVGCSTTAGTAQPNGTETCFDMTP
jgi:prepilin-type N-terminal cleavage/methylation domain-containing protein